MEAAPSGGGGAPHWSPSETRRQIEGQLSLFEPFGAKAGRRKYPVAPAPSQEAVQAWIEDALKRIMAVGAAGTGEGNEPKRTQET